jgi:hypothetical protein
MEEGVLGLVLGHKDGNLQRDIDRTQSKSL